MGNLMYLILIVIFKMIVKTRLNMPRIIIIYILFLEWLGIESCGSFGVQLPEDYVSVLATAYPQPFAVD